MRRILIFFSFQLFALISFTQNSDQNRIISLNFDQFEPKLHLQTDTLYLINFWATWCAPCVKELPAIEQIGEKYKNYKFKILLVSLDFPKEFTTRLIPFINKRKIKSEVILLDDPDQNKWINKVDPNWSGDIPFTLIYNKNNRDYFDKSFNYNELDSIINIKINQP